MKQRSLRVLGALLVALVAGGAVGLTPSAHAQEIQITGPLAGQPAVRRMRMHRLNRVQLAPTLGFTLQDEFARSLMTGLEANVHFTDFLGIGVWGAFANFGNNFHIDTDLTGQVVLNGQTTDRNRLSMPTPCQRPMGDPNGACTQSFADQVARLQGVVSIHLLFAPLRGKLSLFQGLFVDTDFYVLGGFALAFIEERAEISNAATSPRSPTVCQRGGGGMINDPAACLASQTARWAWA